MTQQEQKFGFTFSQLIALIGLIAGLITVWVTLNVRIATVEVQIARIQKDQEETSSFIEQLRRENRENFIKLSDKIDLLIDRKNNSK